MFQEKEMLVNLVYNTTNGRYIKTPELRIACEDDISLLKSFVVGSPVDRFCWLNVVS